MEISVNNKYITIEKNNHVERYAIAHVRKTQKVSRTFTYRKSDKKIVNLIWVCVFATIISGLVVIATWWGLIGVIAFGVACCGLIRELRKNQDYKPKNITFYWGVFVSGNNEQYSLLSSNENAIDGFLNAISHAMSDGISTTYNVSIDQSVKEGADITIENLINKDSGKIAFFEGDIPNAREVVYG